MPLQIGPPKDHGFDEPLGLLSDCHRRIEHLLRVLIAVDAEAAGDALGAAHREALEAALHYFALAAPKHTADEEESLFPRLRESGDAGVREALALVANLEQDHRGANQHHAAAETLARRWLTDDALPPDNAAELRNARHVSRRSIAATFPSKMARCSPRRQSSSTPRSCNRSGARGRHAVR